MIGQSVKHYTILEKLGEGGMGVVYKAEDTTLKRVVALKFLPPQLAATATDKARFLLEAQAAASLNHPNICTIHGIDEHDGQLFIVMEFVDGQTLRQRMPGVNQKQALDIGAFVAEGLAAAHEKGVVHRDVKPENIMIRKDGIAQIMDFGLAKLRSNSSKVNRLTQQGSTVGTAGYMSPEQVQGHDADHRSDIFSLGVMLYELFTGQLPFRGVHETALMYEIVNVDAAPMASLKPEIDPSLDAIILECLEKDPADRYQSVAEVAKDLKKYKRESSRARASRVTAARPVLASGSRGVVPAVAAPSATARFLPWIVAGLALGLALGAVAWAVFRTAPPVPRTLLRAELLPPARVTYNTLIGGHLAIAPDGRTIAFVGSDSTGSDLLYVRPLRSPIATPLAGTAGASYPFWSPDGRSIGFFAGGKLRRIDAVGGLTTMICDAPAGRGGAWNTDGIIVFAPSQFDGLSRVPAGGGIPVPLTKLDTMTSERNHRWPHFLPDGRHLIYTTQTEASGTDDDAVRILDLATGVDSVLLRGSSNVEYSRGYLLFHRQGNLVSQPFDTTTCRLSGDPVPVVERLSYSPLRSRALFAASRDGVLIFQAGDTQGGQPTHVDRAGARLAPPLPFNPIEMTLSHDGKKLAYTMTDPVTRNTDIWIYDFRTGTSSRCTFSAALDVNPIWSPLDDSICYASMQGGRMLDLYVIATNGTGTPRRLTSSPRDKSPMDWSKDGSTIFYQSTSDPVTKADLWTISLRTGAPPVPFLQTEFREFSAVLSPDMHWVAYVSDESGRQEVYVRPYGSAEGKWQISTNGGVNPRWSPKGDKIFFSSQDRRWTVASVHATPGGFVRDSIRVLFELDPQGIAVNRLEIDPSGTTFWAIVTNNRAASPPINLIVNWDEEARRP